MKLLYLLLIAYLIVFAPRNCRSQKAGPDTCQVGAFISSIYSLDYIHESFDADLWLWTLSDTSLSRQVDNLEFPNAKIVSTSHLSYENKGSILWGSVRCKATILYDWSTSSFPFDKQLLHIYIEEAEENSSELVLAIDSGNTKLSDLITLDGWSVGTLKARPIIRTYKTTYGDPTLKGTSSYSAIDLQIPLKRTGVGLFLKLFSGVYIAFAIAMLVFFFKPISDIRYTLAVGALFAAVANKYIIDSLLPPTIGFTLVDKIHIITFLYILGIVLFSGIALHLHNKGNQAMSARFDKAAMWFLLTSYVIFNGAVIIMAARQG
jgi:hypothetical protein